VVHSTHFVEPDGSIKADSHIYTVRPCLIHTCHAAPMSYSDHAVLLKATTRHGRRETACGLPARVRLLPATCILYDAAAAYSIYVKYTITVNTWDPKCTGNWIWICSYKKAWWWLCRAKTCRLECVFNNKLDVFGWKKSALCIESHFLKSVKTCSLKSCMQFTLTELLCYILKL
jgi:hypothetical protein